MTNKKANIMSLSVDLEIQDRLKKVAKQRNISVSKLIRDMIDKNIGPDVENGAVVDTIILKIPSTLKTDASELKAWLQARFDKVYDTLSKVEAQV
jgi:hypothetical protein